MLSESSFQVVIKDNRKIIPTSKYYQIIHWKQYIMLSRNSFLRVLHAIREFISNITTVREENWRQFSISTIWNGLDYKKKKRKNFLLWIIFIEVGIISWDFQGFPRSVWTNVFKRLSSNKQVNKLYFKHQKNSRKIQQIQEFKNHLITDLLAPRTWKKWPIEELDGNNT